MKKAPTRKARRAAALAAAIGGAVLFAGAAVPAAATAAPVPPPAAEASSQQSLRNISVGTHLRFHNKSDQTVTVSLTGNYQKTVDVAPGDWTEIQGNALSGDDISGTITFADGSRLPLYAHNPTITESYVQVGGHKWFGSGGTTVDGKRFHADWNGNWKDPNGDVWKDWEITFQGRG